MAAELLGLETGPLWVGLMAEQLIFEAITFRKENQLDIPFWEALIMSLGFEQDQLQHIFEARQLVDLNLATVDSINTQANPPYGWILVKVPFLGRQVWQPINEWQVPTEVYQTVTRQPDSLLHGLMVTREAMGFRQVTEYEGGKTLMTPGVFAVLPRGRLLNTTWYWSTYAAQAGAIEVQWIPQNSRSRQEDNVFLRTVAVQRTNSTYQCAASVEGSHYRSVTSHSPLKITGEGLAALYRGNTTGAAKRNLYLGFDPREGNIILQIELSGLQQLDNISNSTADYHLTVQVGNKNYPESILFQPGNGLLVIEDRSQRINSHYFINHQSAPWYLCDETPVTRIAFEAGGLVIRGGGPNVLQWPTEPYPANPAPTQALPDWRNLCVKGAMTKSLGPWLSNTLCLKGHKKYLQLRLAQQRIANVLILSAERVDVLDAQGEDAYHSGIYLNGNVTDFAITVVGNLQIMQEQTHLFVVGKNPDNAPAITYTKNPGLPYRLAIVELQPVVETLYQPNPQERHFTTPGILYSWLPGEQSTATLQIVGRYQEEPAQLLLEKTIATLTTQSALTEPPRTRAIFHYTDQAELDPQLYLQQVLPPTTQRGPGLQFQSPQGDEVLHYFEHDRFTINGIHYQVHGQQLYATGAEQGVIEGQQLIHYRHPAQGVGIRLNSPLRHSVLSRDNQTLSINQLKLHQLPERTLIYFEQQAFPWQALQETAHRHRHHHHRTRRQLPDISSSASRPTPWITRLWQGLRGILADTNPRLPQTPDSPAATDYTAHHLQGGLQLLDLVIRKWTGQKYSPPSFIQNFDIDDKRRTTAAQLAYAAQCPAVATLKQSLATKIHESHTTTPQTPWLAYPLPTTDTHNLTHQLT